jgi:glycosyltransferase involved in cell wall biosynthesis
MMAETININNNYLKAINITFLVPAYNEEKVIGNLLNEYGEFIENNKLPWHIFISIDGNDRTEEIVKGFKEKYNFIDYIKNKSRGGKGKAIARALKYINDEYTFLIDADNSIGLKNIINIIMKNQNEDVILLNRYNRMNNFQLRRLIPSRGFNFFVRSILGLNVKDTQTGYKMIETKKLKKAFQKITITNTFYDVALLYYLKKFGCKIKEVNADYVPRIESKFNVIGEVFGQGISLISFRLYHSRIGKHIPKEFIELYYKIFKWI